MIAKHYICSCCVSIEVANERCHVAHDVVELPPVRWLPVHALHLMSPVCYNYVVS